MKKFDIDLITRKLENKNIELENKDIELTKKNNELKNYKSKKYSHEQHRNEKQGNILMTNLNNITTIEGEITTINTNVGDKQNLFLNFHLWDHCL